MSRGALALLLALAPASRAGAAMSTLRKPLSARALALAESYASIPGGLSSLGTNPAGLAAARRPQLESAFSSGVADDTFGFLGWAQPFPRVVAAAGLSYYDGGNIDLVFPGGRTETRSAAKDLVGHLALAAPLPWGLSLGAAAKFYRFELAQEARASGFASDLGAQWRTPLRGFSLGGALQNLGPGVKFERDTDPLPVTWRGGMSYQWTGAAPGAGADEKSSPMLRLLGTADAIKTRDERVVGALGGEAAMDFGSTSMALRLGWRLNTISDGPTFGVGFREGRYTIEYAFGDKRGLGQVHNASFGVRF